MLQDKSKTILSEIIDFFSSKDKAILKTMEVLRTLKVDKITFDSRNNWPVEYGRSDLFLVLLLQPLFSIKNVSGYLHSALFDYVQAAKDTLYRFKNDDNISWRKIIKKINHRIIEKMEKSGTKDSDLPACLIIDDTDFKKTGKHIEQVSRIWSHVAHSTVLGFKGLFLGYWDSKTFTGLDFSLHKEKGKNVKFPNGLSKKDNKKQYKKQRVANSFGSQRYSELISDKISNAISMMQRALSNKISFEYVLMDSWFVCEKVILAVIHTGAHVVGMCKMGTATYSYNEKPQSAKRILEKLKKNKKIRWNKHLHLFVGEAMVTYKEVPVKLFFCRNTKRGNWHLLLTTNTDLSIKKAYEIYSIRWSIEVFFKESKQYFQLGKSQSRDFDAQIADTSICMIQYNLFSLAKRFSAYETLGELFNDTKNLMLELTICKKLWGFFLEFIELIAELAEVDPDQLMERILEEGSDNKFVKLVHLNAA